MPRKQHRAHAGTSQIEHHETTPATTVEESQAEALASQETPVTIVEGTEEQVFEGQEEEWVEFGETQTSETQGMANPGTTAQTEINQDQPVEQPASKPPKPSKRPYIDAVRGHLETGDMTKSQLLGLIMEQFPAVSRGGASTFLSDLLNPRYSFFRERQIVKKSDGALIFADRVLEEPTHEDQPTEAPIEQSGE